MSSQRSSSVESGVNCSSVLAVLLDSVVVPAGHAAFAQGQLGRCQIVPGLADRLDHLLLDPGHELPGESPPLAEEAEARHAVGVSRAHADVGGGDAGLAADGGLHPGCHVLADRGDIERADGNLDRIDLDHQGPNRGRLPDRFDASLLAGRTVEAAHLDAQRRRDIGHPFAHPQRPAATTGWRVTWRSDRHAGRRPCRCSQKVASAQGPGAQLVHRGSP